MENEPASPMYPIKWNHRASCIVGLTVLFSGGLMFMILDNNDPQLNETTPAFIDLFMVWSCLSYGVAAFLEADYRNKYVKWQIQQNIPLPPGFNSNTILFGMLSIILFSLGFIYWFVIEPSSL